MDVTNQWVREQFPIFKEHPDLVYLDSAATTQRPKQVIDRMVCYLKKEHANIHRGVYDLSMEATLAYDKVRSQVKYLIDAYRTEEIIFTKGTTDGINMVASAYGRYHVKAGDDIVISQAEHHSNILPWQQLAKETDANLVYLPVDDQAMIIEDKINEVITERTKIVAVTMVSNAFGTIQPVRKIIHRAHEVGAVILLDGAQSVPHGKVDVVALDADFLAFSAHKMFGPTGVGILYGKYNLLKQMKPYQYGGDMIEYVTEQDATFAPIPQCFEAGTPNIEGVVGFGEAITFMEQVGVGYIHKRERELTEYALKALAKVPHIIIHGPKDVHHRGPVISFSIEDVHPHDVTTILNEDHVAIRAGHHCAQPLMKRMGLPSTGRISLGIYNTEEEIDRCVESLKKVRKWLGYES